MEGSSTPERWKEEGAIWARVPPEATVYWNGSNMAPVAADLQ